MRSNIQIYILTEPALRLTDLNFFLAGSTLSSLLVFLEFSIQGFEFLEVYLSVVVFIKRFEKLV